MKKIFITLSILALTATACKQQTEKLEVISTEEATTTSTPEETPADGTQFKSEALTQVFHKLDGSTITFQEILAQYTGKNILIDVWAAWCPDCIKALPEIKKIKAEFPDVVFVNLSLDKTPEAWKEAITKYGIEGEQFHLNDEKRMKGTFGQAIELNWIPRYIVINKEGKIELFNATEKNFGEIKALLNTLQ
ncbi:TlpA family protein disulfide reductase [Myroides odoratus]|uniref:Thiol-disulfide oxidoreductase n=1 Tax=Myroides odoratus TaxID=256 RepID=A0A378U5E4_MYROD|nr:TlpA disulfide reductase family protein [Myroides odoratus]QQU02557.1 TlpA family protein disulfide reductase [Myroides odoratus]STZ70231.1 thiol-disulfide oxidoreductase [Myroides odoratus]